MEEQKCKYCGKTYDEHVDEYKVGFESQMLCMNLKANFIPVGEQATSPVPPNQIPQSSYLFSDALKLMMEGKKVTKIEWFNKEIYGSLRDGYLMLHKEDGKYYQWILSEADLIGDDFIIVPEGN